MSGWLDIQSGVAGKRNALIESLKRPQRRQARVLRQILEKNCDTEIGKRFGFRDLTAIADYQRRVPLQTYDDIRADIDRMMAGKPGVLCADEVLLFETTGGSGGGSKYLPLTREGIERTRKAVLPWLDDLLAQRPGILRGRAYWSISPATRQPARTPGGTPIGIGNDSGYFGPNLAQAIDNTLAVPASVASIGRVEEWRHATLCHLLACRDLSFVSVWSPTFFLELLDSITRNPELLLSAIEQGGAWEVGNNRDQDCLRLGPDPGRAGELRHLLLDEPSCPQAIWPMLDSISCWNSASSRRYASELGQRFPGTHIQGKGLLATEGVVTIPLGAACSPVLAVDSGFFEFLSDDGDSLLAWELEIDRVYTLVLTSAAGLYRYRLGDRVVVRGWFESSPCLEYVGREGGASDLCGEKLTDAFVASAVGAIPGVGLLVPISDPRPCYMLLLDEAVVAAEDAGKVARLADQALMTNPQYRYAREIGQLAAPEPRRMADPAGAYRRICFASGQRLGDIKPVTLASGWWAERYLATVTS